MIAIVLLIGLQFTGINFTTTDFPEKFSTATWDKT